MAREIKTKAQEPKLDMEYIGSRDEQAEGRTIESRRRLRTAVEDQISQFLGSGGTISHIAPHVTADPPKRPNSNYGSRPI